MENFFRHSPVVVEPMFGRAPETLDAVYVISTLGLSLVFFDNNMLTPDSQVGYQDSMHPRQNVSGIYTHSADIFDDHRSVSMTSGDDISDTLFSFKKYTIFGPKSPCITINKYIEEHEETNK